MSLRPIRTAALQRVVSGLRAVAPRADAAAPHRAASPGAREPDDSDGRAFPLAPPELGWRASSYDLKHGLDVVELPTSLPVEVLDRLFNAPGK
jgi:hypothetical protein